MLLLLSWSSLKSFEQLFKDCWISVSSFIILIISKNKWINDQQWLRREGKSGEVITYLIWKKLIVLIDSFIRLSCSILSIIVWKLFLFSVCVVNEVVEEVSEKDEEQGDNNDIEERIEEGETGENK